LNAAPAGPVKEAAAGGSDTSNPRATGQRGAPGRPPKNTKRPGDLRRAARRRRSVHHWASPA
jgi:hypothetical protein